MAHDFTLAVNAIITKNKKVLLVKRKDRDMWRIPGGEASTGQTIDEAVVSLIKKRLGLDTTIKKVLGLYSKPIQNELVVVFENELIDEKQEIKLDNHYSEAEFYPLDDMPDKFPDKNYERIDDFNNKYEDLVIRTQMSVPSSLKFPKIKSE